MSEDHHAPTARAETRIALVEMAIAAATVLGFATMVLVPWFGGERASQADCDALVARYAEARARQVNPDAAPAELQAAREASARKAAASPRFARCSRQLRRSAITCAEAAPDVDAIERCLQ